MQRYSYQPSWIEVMVFRALNAVLGRPIGALERAVMRTARHVSRPARQSRALGAHIHDPARFKTLLETTPRDFWLMPEGKGQIQALDAQLAEADGATPAASRALLHSYLMSQKLWFDVMPEARTEHGVDALAVRLASAYTQLLRHGEGGALHTRLKQDYDASRSNTAIASMVFKAAHILNDKANADAAPYAAWSDAQVVDFCEPLVSGTTPGFSSGMRYLRFIHPGVMARYVALSAQRDGTLAKAYRMMANLPEQHDYRGAFIGIFEGMAAAIKAGVAATPPAVKERASATKIGRLHAMLASKAPWVALGRGMAALKPSEPKDIDKRLALRMAIMKGEMDSPTPFGALMTVNVAAYATGHLTPAQRGAILYGIQDGLHETVKTRKTPRAAQHVRESLITLSASASMHNRGTGQAIDALALSLPTREKAETLRRLVFTKLPLRATISSEFNTLSALPALSRPEHACACKAAEIVGKALATDGHFGNAAGIFMRLKNGAYHDMAWLGIFHGMVAAKDAGVALDFKTDPQAEPVKNSAQHELQSLLSQKDPWHALGKRMASITDDARAQNELSIVLRPALAGEAAAFLPDDIRNRLLAGVNDGLKAVLRAKKRGALQHAGDTLKSIEGYAAISDYRDGLTITSDFTALVAQSESRAHERMDAIRTIDTSRQGDILTLVRENAVVLAPKQQPAAPVQASIQARPSDAWQAQAVNENTAAAAAAADTDDGRIAAFKPSERFLKGKKLEARGLDRVAASIF